jgi:hypothetical protein
MEETVGVELPVVEEPPEPEDDPATEWVPHPMVAAISRREAKREQDARRAWGKCSVTNTPVRRRPGFFFRGDTRLRRTRKKMPPGLQGKMDAVCCSDPESNLMRNLHGSEPKQT